MLTRARYRENKKDANHDYLAGLFEGWGWGVEQTWRFGHGFFDVVVSNERVGVGVEFKKDAREPLTDAEAKLHARYRGPKGVCWDHESALAIHRRYWSWKGE